MQLINAVDLFLGDFQNPSTKKSYYYCLIPMRDYIGPTKPITVITPAHLIEYGQTLYTKDRAPATVNKHVKAIKHFFRWCVTLELLDKSPATVMHAPRRDLQVPKSKAMTDREFSQLLDYMRWKPRDHALLLFLGDTGCRAAGAANLRIQDIDLDNHTATVTEKFDKSRPVAFGADCAIAIRAWLIKRPKTAGDYIFSRRPTAMKPDNISLIIRRACQVVNIRSLGSHSLRHRKGHQMADAGIAASIAATALGHSDPAITLQHYYPRDWARAKEALESLAHTTKPNVIIPLPKAQTK